MITNHSKNRIIARTGLGPDKRAIICVAIIFGSTTSPIGPTIHVPYTHSDYLHWLTHTYIQTIL
jgi:hypothetical protein